MKGNWFEIKDMYKVLDDIKYMIYFPAEVFQLFSNQDFIKIKTSSNDLQP